MLDKIVCIFRVGKHAGEFESKFLSDLQGGQLPGTDSYCGLEGELASQSLDFSYFFP